MQRGRVGGSRYVTICLDLCHSASRPATLNPLLIRQEGRMGPKTGQDVVEESLTLAVDIATELSRLIVNIKRGG